MKVNTMLDTSCMWHPHENMKSMNLTNVTNVIKINHLFMIVLLLLKM
jgi:hypothetical protein